MKRIELIPSKGSAYVGDTSFTFHCRIEGGYIQINDCKWFKSSGDDWIYIESSNHYDINKPGFREFTDMMNLTVRNIVKSDALKYKYEATVDDGSILSSSATLSVKECRFYNKSHVINFKFNTLHGINMRTNLLA